MMIIDADWVIVRNTSRSVLTVGSKVPAMLFEEVGRIGTEKSWCKSADGKLTPSFGACSRLLANDGSMRTVPLVGSCVREWELNPQYRPGA